MLKCPNGCGGDTFTIQAEIEAHAHDVEPGDGSIVAMIPQSTMWCERCGFEGTLADFTVLDDPEVLREAQKNQERFIAEMKRTEGARLVQQVEKHLAELRSAGWQPSTFATALKTLLETNEV